MRTKNATSKPKTTALVAFCAGTTVLSRTVATTFSSVSTASVVQSATARSQFARISVSDGAYPVAVPRGTGQERGRTSHGSASTASIERLPSPGSVSTTTAARPSIVPVATARIVPEGNPVRQGSAASAARARRRRLRRPCRRRCGRVVERGAEAGQARGRSRSPKSPRVADVGRVRGRRRRSGWRRGGPGCAPAPLAAARGRADRGRRACSSLSTCAVTRASTPTSTTTIRLRSSIHRAA